MTAGTGRFLRRYRLRRPSEYRNVFSKNLRSIDSRFVVLATSNGLGFPRLGLAVSRKKIPLAVSRNRIKRIVRESFRLHSDMLGSCDLVVLAQAGTDGSDRKILQKSLEKHWSKVSQCVRS